jgi:hypothetical protein
MTDFRGTFCRPLPRKLVTILSISARSFVTLILALSTACGGGDGGNSPDSEAPTITIQAPVPGTVQGLTAITGIASDDRGVIAVQFLLDGLLLGPEDASTPYSYQWNTASVTDGPHILGATARDAAGNLGSAATVAITVANTPPAGTLRVVVETGGVHPDIDGYGINLNGGSPVSLQANDSTEFVVPSGSHSVEIQGLATNCSLAGSNPRTVTVAGPGLTRVALSISCLGDLILFSTGSFLATIREDGSSFSPIVSSIANFYGDSPTWSPDGLQIGFHGGALNSDIYRMNPDGSGIVPVTNSPGDDFRPAWSPDGNLLVFSTRRHGGIDIYTIQPDGSNGLRLTPDTTPGADEGGSWSPASDRIVFESTRDGDGEIFVMNGDGSGAIQLTSDTTADFRPAWSPDGDQIAFVTARSGAGQSKLYLMNADGSGQHQLSPDSLVVDYPAWSPDGLRLAFQAYGTDGETDIWVINRNGTGLQHLAHPGAVDSHPAWRPR